MLSILFLFIASCSAFCERGESCWPTTAELQTLHDSLSPNANRLFQWLGGDLPRIGGIPFDSLDEQPLYGIGANGLRPLYIRSEEDEQHKCFMPLDTPYFSEFCNVTTRNAPYNYQPAFVVFPLTAKHVQTCVLFAKAHDLCISIVGAGYDTLNRHTCKDGLMIRTSFLKKIVWDLTGRPDSPDGRVKVGAGVVFSELHQSAVDKFRVVATPFGETLGVVGWALGGGFGPLSPAYGLGADNILEAEVVTADGKFILVNRSCHGDLWWALRGGGGSVWGVVISLTLRAHILPSAGFTIFEGLWKGDMCLNLTQLHQFIDHLTECILNRDKRWGGYVYFIPTATPDESCKARWEVFIQYTFLGSNEETVYKDTLNNLTMLMAPESLKEWNFPTWDMALDTQEIPVIYPGDILSPINKSTPGGNPSILISREILSSGKAAQQLKENLNRCMTLGHCPRQDWVQGLTGNLDSPQADLVSMGLGLRKSVLHWVLGADWSLKDVEAQYKLLGKYSYFEESAYLMKTWRSRYWGMNFGRLLAIKERYDPDGLIECHHCIQHDEGECLADALA